MSEVFSMCQISIVPVFVVLDGFVVMFVSWEIHTQGVVYV